MALPVSPPLEPMLAKAAREIPVGDDSHEYLYEPKWDGFRCLAFRDGDVLDLQSRNSKPLTRYFPELVEPMLAQLPERCVLDGELVVATGKGLDFDALQARQHPAASRVRRLAAETPASYVAFDVLAVGGDDLRGQRFDERRAVLERMFAPSAPPLILTPITADPAVAAEWFERFEGAGLDGIVAKATDLRYRPGERAMVKVKHERTADCVVSGFRRHRNGEGVGSLLLGLYDDAGALHFVGATSAFSAHDRRGLLDVVAPYRLDGSEETHPWVGADAAAGGRVPGAESRWTGGRDMSFEPLRPELVVEVAYDHLQSGRFRHNALFRRWRPDRDPSSCTYRQLEVVPPAELRAVLAG